MTGQSKQRRGDHQRQHRGRPVREAFDEDAQCQHVTAFRQQDNVQRAVLAFGLEQPVEAEQRGQKRADPQDGGAYAGQQVEVGSDTERNDGHHGEEEQDADQRPAAGPDAKPKIADEEG